MQVAYFGCDLYMDCIQILEAHGHFIKFIFVREDTPYNEKLIKFSQMKNIPLVRDKPSAYHMDYLQSHNVDFIFSCKYGWKIPFAERFQYSLNVHPTLLPMGRGPNPLFWVIQKYPECFGVTIHKVTDRFDRGDIIYQESLSLSDCDSIETLMMKLELQMPNIMEKCLRNFKPLYLNAKPQNEGSYWPKVDAIDILIDWNMDVRTIENLVRTLGRFGAIGKIRSNNYFICNIEVMELENDFQNGDVLKEDSDIIAVAASNGIVLIQKRGIKLSDDLKFL